MEEEKKSEQLEKETSNPLLPSRYSEFQEHSTNRSLTKRRAILVTGVLLLVGIAAFWVIGLNSFTSEPDTVVSDTPTTDNQYEAYSAFMESISEYNAAVENYNVVAEEYKKVQEITSLENIAGLPKVNGPKVCLDDNIEFADFLESSLSRDTIVRDTAKIVEETNDLLYALILAQQITNPDEEWVVTRLKSIDDIVDIQAVTEDHDPNQLLNVDGGYTSCVYFSANGIQQGSVKGATIIDKGTDAGGSVEVYKTVTDAQNRCEYLGQFDNTLLYSGSYAILGTIVIRTSYLLTNEQQVELTNKITAAFTALE